VESNNMDDHFTRLGLPRRFAIDAAQLEAAYLTRSRAYHPDYHANSSTSDLSASLDLSAALNEAYTTLKDSFTRAEYLLRIEGGPSATDHRQIPPAFLAEMLESREQVEETRSAGLDNHPRLAALDADFTARYDALMDEIAGRFAGYENHEYDDPKRMELLVQIRSLLNATKYVRGLIRDLHAD
jgi:molecular chaperone HscB